jgi:hypothetical protein
MASAPGFNFRTPAASSSACSFVGYNEAWIRSLVSPLGDKKTYLFSPGNRAFT